jgi:hypothetical protein
MKYFDYSLYINMRMKVSLVISSITLKILIYQIYVNELF